PSGHGSHTRETFAMNVGSGARSGVAPRMTRVIAAMVLVALGAGAGAAELGAQNVAATRPSMGETVKVGTGLYAIVVSESTGTVYVAAAGREAGTIYALDGESLDTKSTIDVSSAPAFGLGLNDRTQTLFTTNTRAGSVSVIDLATGEVTEVSTPAD